MKVWGLKSHPFVAALIFDSIDTRRMTQFFCTFAVPFRSKAEPTSAPSGEEVMRLMSAGPTGPLQPHKGGLAPVDVGFLWISGSLKVVVSLTFDNHNLVKNGVNTCEDLGLKCSDCCIYPR